MGLVFSHQSLMRILSDSRETGCLSSPKSQSREAERRVIDRIGLLDRSGGVFSFIPISFACERWRGSTRAPAPRLASSLSRVWCYSPVVWLRTDCGERGEVWRSVLGSNCYPLHHTVGRPLALACILGNRGRGPSPHYREPAWSRKAFKIVQDDVQPFGLTN